ncbi:MAG: orotate phosphoribosyltransferase [Gammaproteobacteria bacterium HGW-Gammaproteobacteria-5]|nr:MAG: orotate phosphoribosyltransferase [Gammaproteobacteria bacterium HGW-Gammaproteobacteria-5]PKM16553.1 MAG: orotate phosphoribosyltransferase [Gammaproteobacteria bacterium HGW-Gammaproteobacteria-2]
MKPHQHRFLELALAREALRFGEFTLKSGRSSPYFFNAGRFDSGAALATLGECYADALAASGIAFDGLFGPAYKGIPLATALALALAARGCDLPLSFNRKEVKAHGEGGSLIGAPLRGRVLIVDDVITAGTAIRESIAIIQQAGAEVAGIVLALDRQERGQNDQRSAAQEVADTFAIPVCAIASLDELLQFAGTQPDMALQRDRLLQYREQYGCSK